MREVEVLEVFGGSGKGSQKIEGRRDLGRAEHWSDLSPRNCYYGRHEIEPIGPEDGSVSNQDQHASTF